MARWCGMIRCLWNLPRIWNSHYFCRRLNSLPLTEKLSRHYAYVRLWYPHSESGCNVTNGGAIAHAIRERRVEIQKYENPFDASKIIWMFFLYPLTWYSSWLLHTTPAIFVYQYWSVIILCWNVREEIGVPQILNSKPWTSVAICRDFIWDCDCIP